MEESMPKDNKVIKMNNVVIVSALAVILAMVMIGEANIINVKGPAALPQPENALNLIVGFNAGIPTDISEKVQAHGGKVVSKNMDINFIVVDPKGRDRNELKAHLQKISQVDYVEEDTIVTALFDPNDPGYSNQWGPPGISAPQAWDITMGTQNVIIAIIDTGVDCSHPDIAPNCITGGKDFINNDNNPTDDQGHGTHVAGIAAAVINNGAGVAGMSQSKILAEKVLNSQGSGTSSTVANGIIHAAKKGAKVISMSLGGGPSLTMQNAVNYAWNRGALLVAAAGNENSTNINYPAGYANVISVSALNSDNTKATYSNYGATIDLAAPGTGIYSTVPTGACALCDPSGYKYLSGTSMATPFVSGSAALVLSQNSALANYKVRAILEGSADDLGTSGKDNIFGNGRVNPYKALLTPTP
jgi:thermitase